MNLDEWYKGGDRILVDDLHLFYRRAGEGEPLLCIHGFPTSSWDFALIWPALIQHFDVMATDLIGLGRSAKPKRKITIALQADRLEQFMLQQGIQSAHLLAHDLGDTVALELLARQLEGNSKINWQSCILMNGGIFPETYRPLLIQKLLLSPIGPLVAQFTSEGRLRKSMQRIFSVEHPPSESFLKGSWKLLIENRGKSMIPRVIQYMRERVLFKDRWMASLMECPVPIRLINGAQDPISGIHVAKCYQETIPNPDVQVIQEAGHYPHVEVPKIVIAAILEFHELLAEKKISG